MVMGKNSVHHNDRYKIVAQTEIDAIAQQLWSLSDGREIEEGQTDMQSKS